VLPNEQADVKVKWNLSLHAMKPYGGVEASLHTIVTSALYRGPSDARDRWPPV